MCAVCQISTVHSRIKERVGHSSSGVDLWHGLVFWHLVGSASYRMVNLSVVQTAVSSNYRAFGRESINGKCRLPVLPLTKTSA